jgi:hypothetical protein
LRKTPDLHLDDRAVGEHLLVMECKGRPGHMAQDAIRSPMASRAIVRFVRRR